MVNSLGREVKESDTNIKGESLSTPFLNPDVEADGGPVNECASTSESPDTSVCSLFVTYHPNIEEFRVALVEARKGSSYVVVVDNSPDADTQSKVRALVEDVSSSDANKDEHVRFLLKTCGQNLGLSKAYNIGAAEGRRLGAKFLLLLDQDSHLTPETIKGLLETWKRLSAHFAVGSISGRNLEEVKVNVGLEPLANMISSFQIAHASEKGLEEVLGLSREIRTFTNSGTMISMDLYERMGEFNTALFLDAIDYDYSLRLRASGFRLFLAHGADLHHRQGSYLRRKFLGFSLNLRTYPPVRSYWIVRGTLEFASTWFRKFPLEVTSVLLRQMSGTFGAIWFLEGRKARGRLVLKAFSDFGHGIVTDLTQWQHPGS